MPDGTSLSWQNRAVCCILPDCFFFSNSCPDTFKLFFCKVIFNHFFFGMFPGNLDSTNCLIWRTKPVAIVIVTIFVAVKVVSDIVLIILDISLHTNRHCRYAVNPDDYIQGACRRFRLYNECHVNYFIFSSSKYRTSTAPIAASRPVCGSMA